MLVGIYGILFEFYSPGLVGPGVVGAICLLLALYAFQVLPVNYAGVGLALLGVAMLTAEAFVPSFGILGLAGIVALVVGSIMLMEGDVPGFTIAWGLIAGVAGGDRPPVHHRSHPGGPGPPPPGGFGARRHGRVGRAGGSLGRP